MTLGTRARTREDFLAYRRLQEAYEASLDGDLRHELPDVETLEARFAGTNAAFLLKKPAGVAGSIVVCEVAGETGDIQRLYVDPAFRRLGVATDLIATAIAHGRACGYARMTLETASDRLRPAFDLYRSLGFRVVAPSVPLRYADQVFLELRL